MQTDRKGTGMKSNDTYKEYFQYLIPTIIGQIAHCCYCLADVFFVGKGVGAQGLAALNIALPVFTVYTTFSLMIGVGAATTISVCRGTGSDDDCNRIFTMAVGALLAIGALFSLAGIFFLPQIARLFGATNLLVQGVVDYLKPIAPLAIVYMMTGMLSVIVRGDGNPRLVMMAGTIGNVTNIILDYVFVLPLGMGIFGAGLATIIGPCIGLMLLSLHFIKRRNQVTLVKSAFSRRLLIRLLRNGLGSGVLEISAGFVIFLFNITILRVGGASAVAVFTLISNIGYVAKGIFNGMAQAAQPIIGLSHGRGEHGRVYAVNRCALATALCFALVVYGLIVLFPSQIMGFFVSLDEKMLAIGTPAILLYFISLPFTGINTILMYFFQSVERPLLTFLMAIARGIVLVFVSLTIFAALWGLSGVWLAMVAAEGIAFAVFFPIFARSNARHRE